MIFRRPERVPASYVRQQLQCAGAGAVRMYDETYVLHPWRSVLTWARLRRPLWYVPDDNDCNRMAAHLMDMVRERFRGAPMGVAVVDGGTHAVNVYVDERLAVRWYDWQRNAECAPKDCAEVIVL